ncbi:MULTISPECIES: DUF4892 domain-containing protein [Nitrincola]|uniref:DUF4892 domain-containing protein n=1 Tax=Nitrincola nitratireducens TaxID=1229521 RepID=W9UZ85_9GAMM|nr:MULTISPECIES: DUF4892 domain-containing protein [Nitrincola]EXJ09222.1 hypothetical protein D791_03868 [Nitrincola nitratireducens]
MQILRYVLVVSLFSVLSCSSVFAQQPSGLPDWFQVFPLSSLEMRTQKNEPDYLLALSQITRIQGLLRTQNERRLNGTLIRHTWQLAAGHGPEQGFDHVKQQLIAQGANILYECSSRQCGASNLWANQIFGYANLLGVDSSQYYLAAEVEAGHMALYAVRRGNGRVYLHLDYIVDPSQPAASQAVAPEPQVSDRDIRSEAPESSSDVSWLRLMESQGFAQLPGWPDRAEDAKASLKDYLDQHPTQRLRVVLHRASFSTEPLLTQTNAEAQAFLSALVNLGINIDRIDIYGAGSLAPEAWQGRTSSATVMVIKED